LACSNSVLQQLDFWYVTTCTPSVSIHPHNNLWCLKFYRPTIHMFGYHRLACHTSSCAGCAAWQQWQTLLHEELSTFWGQVALYAGSKRFNNGCSFQVCATGPTTARRGFSMKALPCSAWLLYEKTTCAGQFDLVNICTVSAALTTPGASLSLGV
jgi:hypothetical protein